MKRRLILLSVLSAFCMGAASFAQEAQPDQELQKTQAVEELSDSSKTQSEDIDMGKIIFSHIEDAYEWHIFTWHGRHKTTEAVIYLPCMVISKNAGFETFGSRRMLESMARNGSFVSDKGTVFLLAGSDSPHKGHLMEQTPEGLQRPWDFSITRNVLALLISTFFLLWIILATASWYRRHDPLNEAPTGVAALMEPIIMMVHDMARENIGPDYKKFSPYLCLAFLFILFNNFVGIIPFFPGGSNLTGNIAVTLVLALFTFFISNLSGTKHYYKSIFNPDVPLVMKPLMAVIEVFSTIMRPLSLTIRLFANMMAGHIQTIAIVSLIFIMWQVGKVLFGSMTVISVFFGIFLDLLEILISFIQAYVFTILSCIYIGLAREK